MSEYTSRSGVAFCSMIRIFVRWRETIKQWIRACLNKAAGHEKDAPVIVEPLSNNERSGAAADFDNFVPWEPYQFPHPRNSLEYAYLEKIVDMYKAARTNAALSFEYMKQLDLDEKTFKTYPLASKDIEHQVAKDAIVQCLTSFDACAEVLHEGPLIWTEMLYALRHYYGRKVVDEFGERAYSEYNLLDLRFRTSERPVNKQRHAHVHDYGLVGRIYSMEEDGTTRYRATEHWRVMQEVLSKLEKPLKWMLDDLERKVEESRPLIEEGAPAIDLTPTHLKDSRNTQRLPGTDWYAYLEEWPAASFPCPLKPCESPAMATEQMATSISAARLSDLDTFVQDSPSFSRDELATVKKLLKAWRKSIAQVRRYLETFNVGEDVFRNQHRQSTGELRQQAVKDAVAQHWTMEWEIGQDYSKKADEFERWFLRKAKSLGISTEVLGMDSRLPLSVAPKWLYAEPRRVRNWCAHEYTVPGLGGNDAGSLWSHIHLLHPKLAGLLDCRLQVVERLLEMLPEEPEENAEWSTAGWEVTSGDGWGSSCCCADLHWCSTELEGKPVDGAATVVAKPVWDEMESAWEVIDEGYASAGEPVEDDSVHSCEC